MNETPNTEPKNNDKNNNNEVLDLGDLDLSQLRLSKKDLETLSNLTPSLPKNLQEQLISQLPPTQARKLCRTLSMQNGKNENIEVSTQMYRRSMSTNRDSLRHCRESITPTNETDYMNNNSSRFRRSVSKDDRLESDNVNNNHCRESVLSPIDNKYSYERKQLKYTGSRHSTIEFDHERSKSLEYDKLLTQELSRSIVSPIKEFVNRPPSGMQSPPILDETRRSQKRISRFLRPDFFEDNSSKSSLGQEKASREMETQKVLREIREKSRERSVDRIYDCQSDNRLSYLLDKYTNGELTINKHLVLNGLYAKPHESSDSIEEISKNRKNYSNGQTFISSTISDKILDELNNISLLNNQLEKFDQHNYPDEEKVVKVKKVRVKSADSTVKKNLKKNKEISVDSNELNVNNSIENSACEDISERSKGAKESKIARPKSYPYKDSSLKLSATESSDVLNECNNEVSNLSNTNELITSAINEDSKLNFSTKLIRPKSFPNSKITPPRELKKPSEKITVCNSKENSVQEGSDKSMCEDIPTEKKKTKKTVKIVRKKSSSEEVKESEILEKSPEKRTALGIFATIGQKFDKLRETKIKDKKVETKQEQQQNDAEVALTLREKKKKLKAAMNDELDEALKSEKKSRIDAMIKNLREKSLPRNSDLTESGYIKRAVSVEEMPNTFNKNAVNKVLGLFKKIEKDNDHKVQSTKSMNNLENSGYLRSKDRPKSSGFVNVNKLKIKNQIPFDLNNISESKIPIKYNCPDCNDPQILISTNSLIPSRSASAVTKRHSTNEQSVEDKERIRNNNKEKRKGLLLDLNSADMSKKHENNKSNYTFPPPLPNEIVKHNSLHTTTYDNLTNYSSSTYEDSTSTFLSPTDDHEMFFDDWSTCSDEQNIANGSRMCRLSKINLPPNNQNGISVGDDPSESVIDRIRRKSYYSRFNEKKSKRVSSIVGPSSTKEYYRERSTRPLLEYTKSATSIIPDISGHHNHEFLNASSRATLNNKYLPASSRSTSQSRSSTTASKYSNDKSSADIPHSSSFRRSIYENNSHPTPHHHHYPAPIDDLASRVKARNTMYDSSSSSSNQTTPSLSSIYRRSSFTTPSSLASPSSNVSTNGPMKSIIDGYATIGRKMRQYNNRTVSLLDPTITNNGYGTLNQQRPNVLNDNSNPNGVSKYVYYFRYP